MSGLDYHCGACGAYNGANAKWCTQCEFILRCELQEANKRGDSMNVYVIDSKDDSLLKDGSNLVVLDLGPELPGGCTVYLTTAATRMEAETIASYVRRVLDPSSPDHRAAELLFAAHGIAKRS